MPGMKVFVSYQRADTATAAHALGYALRLGGHQAFVDTGSIGLGELYRQVIANEVATSQLMFALIGPSFDARRLHEPTSVVTYEWQRARFHGAAVVPVVVDGAAMPADEQLPAALRWLPRRNALSLRRASFSADIDACVSAVPALATTPGRAPGDRVRRNLGRGPARRTDRPQRARRDGAPAGCSGQRPRGIAPQPADRRRTGAPSRARSGTYSTVADCSAGRHSTLGVERPQCSGRNRSPPTLEHSVSDTLQSFRRAQAVATTGRSQRYC